MNNKFAEIIPHLRLPRYLGIFDYKIPSFLIKRIKKGHLVTIPFRQKKVIGLVNKTKNKTLTSSSKLKSIKNLWSNKVFFSSINFKFLWWVAQYYFISPALVFKLFPLFSFKDPNNKEQSQKLKISSLKNNSDLSFPVLVQFFKRKTIFQFYKELLSSILKQKNKAIFIFPEEKEASKFSQFLVDENPSLKSKWAFVTSRISKKELQKIWTFFKKGKTNIIIGTQIIVFLPYKNLDFVVLDQEESEYYKNSQNPRYHVRDLVFKLGNLFSSRIILTSITPSLESFYKIKKGKLAFKQLESLHSPPFRIVNLSSEKKKQYFEIISPALKKEIEKYLNKNKRIFILYNRKGIATTIFCRDCGFRLACSNCGVNLALHYSNQPNKKYILICHYCGHKSDPPARCPVCGGFKLKLSGKGLEKIKEELKHLFPKVQIFTIDQNTPEKEIKKQAKSKIIIGTVFSLSRINFNQISLIVIGLADQFLNFAEYKAQEKTFHIFSKLIYNLNEKKVPILIQTFQPHSPVFKAFKKGNLELFYKKELALRKKFNFPPFCQLLKLIYQRSRPSQVLSETMKLYKKLQKEFKNTKGIEILEPLSQRLLRKRKLNRYAILIKISNLKIWNRLSPFLNKLDENWLIDRDTQTLIE